MQTAQIPQINLISKKKAKYDKQLVEAVKGRKLAMVVLVVFAGLSLAASAGNMYVSNKLDETRDSIEAIKLALSARQENVSNYESVSRRVKLIQKLIQDRREVVKLWQQLQSILPAGCQLNSFGLEGDTLSAAISAPHVLVANELIGIVEQGMGLEAKSSTVNISRKADAQYVISVDFSLKKSKTNIKEVEE